MTTVSIRRDELWNAREACDERDGDGRERARSEGARMRDAILRVGCAVCLADEAVEKVK